MVAAGNFISDEQAERIKKVLSMTAVGRLFEEEKERYGRDCRAEGEANIIVKLVENKMKTGNVSTEEACQTMGIPVSMYESAKELLVPQTVAV